jgi:lantibiotic modifying enzyme
MGETNLENASISLEIQANVLVLKLCLLFEDIHYAVRRVANSLADGRHGVDLCVVAGCKWRCGRGWVE